MPSMRLEVSGLRELQRELRSIDRSLPRELRAFNKEAADVIADEAKRLAPVGPTGRLKASIGTQASQRHASIKAGSAVRVPYAGPVIGGHGPPRPQGGFVRPNKFIQRAMGRKAKDFRKVYDTGINKLVKRLT